MKKYGKRMKWMLAAIFVGAFALMFFKPQNLTEISNANRVPAGFLKSAASNLFGDIYRSSIKLGSIPFKTIKHVIIKYALVDYVNKLPVPNDVKERVIKKMKDKKYLRKVVPFIWGLKNFYTLPEEKDKMKFAPYARRKLDPKVIGTDHELFTWQESSKKKKDKSFEFSADMAAQVLVVFDSLFLQGQSIIELDQEDLRSPYQRLSNSKHDRALIKKTKPLVVKLLTFVNEKLFDKEKDSQSSEEDGGASANAEAAQLFNDLLSNPKKLDAVTITLIDFIRSMAHKNYRMFALQQIRQMDFENWALKIVENNNPKELIELIDYMQNQRRYGVQVVVDGLQGHLMEALQRGQQDDPFLKSTLAALEKSKSFKPSKTSTEPPNHAHNFEFLKFITDKGYQDDLYLPYFRSIYSRYGNTIANSGISTTPTISIRNLPMIYSGADVAGPGGTGIPNFHFVDRPTDRAYYFYGNDAILIDELVAQRGMQSMFERLQNMPTMNCNAMFDWHSDASLDALANLAIGEALRDFGDALCLHQLSLRAENERKMQEIRKDLLYNLNRQAKANGWIRWSFRGRAKNLIRELKPFIGLGMPQYLLYYNPWPDHFAHFVGPFSNEILSPTGELNRLDYWLGQIEAKYKKTGLLNRTLFGMAGDHGLTPIFYRLNPEVTVLEKLSKELNHKIIVKKISSDEGEGPKINHATKPESNKNIDVIIASTAGGNYMMDFFIHSQSQWKRQPLHHQLTSLKLLNGGPRVNIVREIVTRLRETLDYLAVRKETCQLEKAAVDLVGYHRGKIVKETIYRRGKKIYYTRSNGNLLDIDQLSPFEANIDEDRHKELLNLCTIQAKKSDPKTWCDEDQWRELASYTPRPDSVVQLAHIYDEDRAGTINLFPKEGIGYNTKVPGRHAGEHFHEKDAFVGFWGEPTKGAQPLRSAVNASLAPTLYEYIMGEKPVVGKKGWGFPSLLDQIQDSN